MREASGEFIGFRPLFVSFAVACALCAALFLIHAPAFAFEDGAGNVLASEGDSVSTRVEGDMYWAGASFDQYALNIGGDLIAAGQGFDIDNSSIAGSVRLAAQSISLSDCSVARTMTLAAESVILDGSTSANAIYIAAQDIVLGGSCKTALMAGDTVVLNGKVAGDVHVSAAKLVISSDAEISGTVYANVALEPDIAASAQVGDLEVAYCQDDLGGFGSLGMLGLLYWPVSGCILALLITLLLPRFVSGGAGTLKARCMPTLASGLIFLVAIVPVLVLLAISVFAIPAAFSILGALAAVCTVAAPAAGSMLGMLVFPNLNRFACAAIGGAAFGVGACIPFLKYVFALVALVVVFGCLVQCAWLNIRVSRHT